MPNKTSNLLVLSILKKLEEVNLKTWVRAKKVFKDQMLEILVGLVRSEIKNGLKNYVGPMKGQLKLGTNIKS